EMRHPSRELRGQNNLPQAWPFDNRTCQPRDSAYRTAASISLFGCLGLNGGSRATNILPRPVNTCQRPAFRPLADYNLWRETSPSVLTKLIYRSAAEMLPLLVSRRRSHVHRDQNRRGRLGSASGTKRWT